MVVWASKGYGYTSGRHESRRECREEERESGRSGEVLSLKRPKCESLGVLNVGVSEREVDTSVYSVAKPMCKVYPSSDIYDHQPFHINFTPDHNHKNMTTRVRKCDRLSV